jgi:hypothetical protein
VAIPARPQLPAFLNDVIGSAPTPAPVGAVAGVQSPTSQKYRDANWYRTQRSKQKTQQQVADEQGWPDWIRKGFGLAATGRDAALRGVEDMVTNYRSGFSQDLSPQAINWAKQQPYLEMWSRGKTSNVADQFPILNGLL